MERPVGCTHMTSLIRRSTRMVVVAVSSSKSRAMASRVLTTGGLSEIRARKCIQSLGAVYVTQPLQSEMKQVAVVLLRSSK